MARKYIKNCTGDSAEKSTLISRAIFRVLFYILLLGFIGVSVYILFFSEYLQINNIKITGNQELSEQSIRQTFKSYLSGKFLNIIPKNNFLFISQKGVSELLENNFKKIRKVSITKKFPDSVSIQIDERKAVLVWCASENCFLLDENGVAYNNADFNSEEIVQNHLLRINDISAKGISIGDKIIDSSYEQYVISIKDAIRSIGLKIGDDAYETSSNMAQEINVRTSEGVWLYFSTQFPLESAIRTLDIVLKKEISQDKLENVDYIDLRSEGKAFYKFKETQ